MMKNQVCMITIYPIKDWKFAANIKIYMIYIYLTY